MLSGSDQTGGHAVLRTSTVVGVRGGTRRHPAATGCRYCLPGIRTGVRGGNSLESPAAALPSSQRSTEGALRCEPTAGCATLSMPTGDFAWRTAATRIRTAGEMRHVGFVQEWPPRPAPPWGLLPGQPGLRRPNRGADRGCRKITGSLGRITRFFSVNFHAAILVLIGQWVS